MPHQRILAHHLVMTGYGFWIANDPRGSGSIEIRAEKFEELGPLHQGRKRIQPSRQELRDFYLKAERKLDHKPLWFDAESRRLIGSAFAEVVKRQNYTVWACFIGTNHAHLCIRYHRDKYEEMHAQLVDRSRAMLVKAGMASAEHRVWAAERPYSVYQHTPEDIHRTIQYIEGNAAKEGLAKQMWEFVKNYEK